MSPGQGHVSSVWRTPSLARETVNELPAGLVI